MKVAVSIPDEVFESAEAWARRAGKSRSEVYARALREYVGRHAPDQVTEAMDRVCEAVGAADDAFARVAARRALKRSEW
jgi:metal-responsive CopG/Arc/MetJ family transcriptional regulator